MVKPFRFGVFNCHIDHIKSAKNILRNITQHIENNSAKRLSNGEKKNPERNLELNRQSCKRTRILLKQQVFQKLGNRCNSLNCRWINEDGSKGCTDPGCLQIDHVFGNGNIERTHNHLKDGRKFYKKVLTDTTGSYQILCANCNWIKRYDENSVGGGPRKISKMLLPEHDSGRTNVSTDVTDA